MELKVVDRQVARGIPKVIFGLSVVLIGCVVGIIGRELAVVVAVFVRGRDDSGEVEVVLVNLHEIYARLVDIAGAILTLDGDAGGELITSLFSADLAGVGGEHGAGPVGLFLVLVPLDRLDENVANGCLVANWLLVARHTSLSDNVGEAGADSHSLMLGGALSTVGSDGDGQVVAVLLAVDILGDVLAINREELGLVNVEGVAAAISAFHQASEGVVGAAVADTEPLTKRLAAAEVLVSLFATVQVSKAA